MKEDRSECLWNKLDAYIHWGFFSEGIRNTVPTLVLLDTVNLMQSEMVAV